MRSCATITADGAHGCTMRWRAVVLAVAAGVILGGVSRAAGAEEWFDRIDDALTMSTPQGEVRARLSGTLDLEAYGFSQPAPGLISSRGEHLFNPRLSVFFDVQVGRQLYGFAQFRADRGFDPGPRRARGRLDEYALRLMPWEDGRFNVQVGKFGTVVGNWVPRHGSWENPFITAPLAYENLTGMWDTAAASSVTLLRDWAHVSPRRPRGAPAGDKHLRLPILWGPSYTTGVAVSGERGRMTYAFELKDASLASRPRAWSQDEFRWTHPTVSGRLGFRPNRMWNLGVSASSGAYLLPSATASLPPGQRLGDYREIVIGHDIGFAWHHWQVWAEVFGARFTIPSVGDADTFSYYVEAKYKLTPQFSMAVRWNEHLYLKMPDGGGRHVRWGANTRRIEVGPAYRFTPHIQLKLQYSLQHDEVSARAFSHAIAAQFVVRF